MKSETLLFPHGDLTGPEVMVDYLEDNLRRLNRVLESVDDNGLYWLIDPESISIATILWHMGRILDVFFTQLALGLPSEEERWLASGWAKETGYDPRGLGRDGWGSLNEYSPEEVAAIPMLSQTQLMEFLADVYHTLREYLKATAASDLAQPAAGFEGKFTRYQVISMALMDNVRHLGEIRLIKSLWERSKR
jgi:hypothetical protein